MQDSHDNGGSQPGAGKPEQGADLPHGGEGSATKERFRTIYHGIRERITFLDYLPGQRLSEEDLAREFGVSRTPVRRVLMRLESEGLLESRHGVGTFVTVLNIDELRDIYRLRKELSGLAGTMDPLPVTPEIIDAIIELREGCRLVKAAENPKKAFARVNLAFFEELMKLVSNKPFRQILERLFYRTARMWPAMTSDEMIITEAEVFYEEIGEYIRFLQAGDVDSAFHLRRSHISLAFNRLESYHRANLNAAS
ncbi:MAG: GntR family transcriptional regulator [Hyphomicrobiales bacterium]|nr:MAG: GntR family transcriptional regulator [Hyphomicrobiales bacterium]